MPNFVNVKSWKYRCVVAKLSLVVVPQDDQVLTLNDTFGQRQQSLTGLPLRQNYYQYKYVVHHQTESKHITDDQQNLGAKNVLGQSLRDYPKNLDVDG
jgi:hypothetical protein